VCKEEKIELFGESEEKKSFLSFCKQGSSMRQFQESKCTMPVAIPKANHQKSILKNRL
jgi:hypothetical protein